MRDAADPPAGLPAMRDAVRDDLPAILALLADDEYSAGREGGADDAVSLAFAAIEADPKIRLLVLDDDGIVIGCAQLTVVPGLARRGLTRGIVEAVRIASNRRGCGLGRHFMGLVVEAARGAGCGVVQLTSDKRRLDAHRFYRDLGFEQTHEGFKLTLA